MKHNPYIIQTYNGLIELELNMKPLPATLRGAPAWLNRFKFITHISHTDMERWNLTELSTGMAVVRNCCSRAETKRSGLERILQAGRKAFCASAKNNKLPKAKKK